MGKFTLILIYVLHSWSVLGSTLTDDKYQFCPCVNKALTVVRFSTIRFVVLFIVLT